MVITVVVPALGHHARGPEVAGRCTADIECRSHSVIQTLRHDEERPFAAGLARGAEAQGWVFVVRTIFEFAVTEAFREPRPELSSPGILEDVTDHHFVRCIRVVVQQRPQSALRWPAG